ncbi:cytosolic carboxypeptidase 2 isoform X2 [Pectinophora gossypiella]|uniref:cytosolic carboxypeptidase 2 isoform X2 n=1 Tax=Pectinophora gossypiella TaxID=13191 RepID=UPI00214F3BFB|nr:cytosolic carboxypeptidase 2 isoform X2 [Pectinophora gossypiella]
MLWWKQIERVQYNVMMIEKEEERNRQYNENATLTLSLPTRDPVLQDNLLIANIEQVKSLQASLFPICNKGTFISNFLQNNIKTNLLEINTDIRTFRTTAKLKEPRDLFALPKELDCPQQAPRWPSECQVVEEKIQHITWTPTNPEPYYISTGKELKPQPVGEEAGTVIFQYYPMSAVNYFSRSTVGGSRLYLSACASAGGGGVDDELRFESRFESGNLAKAIRITSAYYELHLRTDLYTNRHMQWFYFRVTNTKKQTMYRFSIVNLSKAESLYNEGMRPLLYSTKDAQLHSIGWRRCGDNIAYYKNDSTCEEEEQFPSYTLTFNIEFPHSDDAVYIAHCYPYTYSDLQEYLSRLQSHPIKSTYSKLRLLCRTLAGNNVYYLTITAPPNPNELEPKKKKAVVITARVHPGETPSSWMMKGFLDYLTGDSSQARELREKFIFKLVPMLNPDGVIVGNNRCSLTGKDLNRQYRTVIRETYPPVWHTKVMIRRLQEECGVALYVDLHAHSRKHNVFIYGCESRRNSDKRLQEQVFPLMLHKNAADKFSFENCKFRIQRSKEGTGRVVVWMLGVANSYTMEASFGGSELGSRMSTHFSVQDYESLGKTFCETLLDFYDEDPSKERLRNKIVTRLLKEGSNADEPTNIDLSDYSSDEGDTSSSSSDAVRQPGDLQQTAPPPSPIFPDINRNINDKPKKPRPRLEKSKRIEKKKAKRETLQVSRATIDLTSDGMSDATTDDEMFEENLSPIKRVHKLLHSSSKPKARRKKKMPPELKIIRAPTSDSPYYSDREKKSPKCGRPRSVSMINEPIEKPRLTPASWHQFRRLPPPKCLSDNKNRFTQPSELQVKLNSLKKNVWTGVHNDERGPLSWGISTFAMNSYFTDSEALLRSCSKKLEELEGERKKSKDEKKKKKAKNKKLSLKVPSSVDDILEPISKLPKAWKKKGKLKHTKSENSPYVNNASFTDIPRNTQPSQKTSPVVSRQAKTNFRKSAFVMTAIQTKKSVTKTINTLISDNSDSEDSIQSTKKVKKKSKTLKTKSNKINLEGKFKN